MGQKHLKNVTFMHGLSKHDIEKYSTLKIKENILLNMKYKVCKICTKKLPKYIMSTLVNTYFCVYNFHLLKT